MGVTLLPSPVPLGCRSRGREASKVAEEAVGQSPAFSFPAWAAGTRCVRQEAQRYPCASCPASQRGPPPGSETQQHPWGLHDTAAKTSRFVLVNLCQMNTPSSAACRRVCAAGQSPLDRDFVVHTPCGAQGDVTTAHTAPTPWFGADRLCLLLHAECV